jgi:hypothetical protein
MLTSLFVKERVDSNIRLLPFPAGRRRPPWKCEIVDHGNGRAELVVKGSFYALLVFGCGVSLAIFACELVWRTGWIFGEIALVFWIGSLLLGGVGLSRMFVKDVISINRGKSVDLPMTFGSPAVESVSVSKVEVGIERCYLLNDTKNSQYEEWSVLSIYARGDLRTIVAIAQSGEKLEPMLTQIIAVTGCERSVRSTVWMGRALRW